MVYQDVIIDRGWIGNDPASKHGLRKATLLDWLPVIKLFLQIVWRETETGRLDAATAWEVAEDVNGIVRDVNYWKRFNQ